ncbi:MAG: MBL fold metallo-hydrolase [Candidatus Latescibacteria bacterium]|jgi:ribonuclease BN (tRNA processing enzyme)|nr:MBL fold metallo-hydrolase [Candidatus Latescibacterota bacterium]
MSLTVTLLGTGTPTPLARRAGASTLVTLGDEALMFDCGPGSARRLLDKGVSPREITGLFLTHLHYDHCMDYAYLVLNRWDQGIGQIPELQVRGPAPLARMTDLLFSEDGVFGPDLAARTRHPGSDFVYEMRGGVLPRARPAPVVSELTDGDTVEGEGWTVRAVRAVHCQPQLSSLAYRLDSSEGSVVVTGDTAPADGITGLSSGADVLVHMCHLLNGVVTDPRITDCCSGHLDAARTARDAGVRTLVLVHMTEQLERPGIRERVLHEAAEVFGGHIIYGEDLLDVPLGDITPERIQ